MNNIQADHIEIGQGSFIESTATIRGLNGNAKSIVIGDHCYIGENVQIICDDFSLGDYSKIHHHTNIHGYKPCNIGHNAWIGQYCIIDSIGGMTIGNNCGIGAHSQLWSHIKYGDTLEGCRFLSEKEMKIGNDVWFVGHCIVSPINAADKSMAMVGSVVTKDMEFNHIYAGAPAKDLSDKIGFQFNEGRSDEEKKGILEGYLRDCLGSGSSVRIVYDRSEIQDEKISYFVISERKYTKRGSDDEIQFMKYLLPEKAKFTPLEL